MDTLDLGFPSDAFFENDTKTFRNVTTAHVFV